MKNYRLIKSIRGSKFLYMVVDAEGNVISKRMSARRYVACTANGEFYFGRADLIGKGEHGRVLKFINHVLHEESIHMECRRNEGIPITQCFLDRIERLTRRKAELSTIAYLQTTV